MDSQQTQQSIQFDDCIGAMDRRQESMMFPNGLLVKHGGADIDDEVDKIREAILVKDGIVDPKDEDGKIQRDFRYFIKNCMNQ